ALRPVQSRRLPRFLPGAGHEGHRPAVRRRQPLRHRLRASQRHRNRRLCPAIWPQARLFRRPEADAVTAESPMTVNKAAKHGCVAKSAAGRKSAAGLARIQKRESVMRRFIIAGLALGAPIVPVMAADMPAYDKVPVPAFSWTGFYLGGDIG